MSVEQGPIKIIRRYNGRIIGGCLALARAGAREGCAIKTVKRGRRIFLVLIKEKQRREGCESKLKRYHGKFVHQNGNLFPSSFFRARDTLIRSAVVRLSSSNRAVALISINYFYAWKQWRDEQCARTKGDSNPAGDSFPSREKEILFAHSHNAGFLTFWLWCRFSCYSALTDVRPVSQFSFARIFATSQSRVERANGLETFDSDPGSFPRLIKLVRRYLE